MPRSINTNPEHKTQTQNTEDKNTCPENFKKKTCPNLFQTHAQKIYSKHMPKFIPNTCPENFKKKTQIQNDAIFVCEDLEGALAGDDLTPDLINGFRNRNGIRGFDEGDLGVLLANPGEGSTRRRKRSTRVLGSYESRLADREARA